MRLRVPWGVPARASGAGPSSLGPAQAAVCAVAALSTETSPPPVPAAMSIGTILLRAHSIGCAPALLSPSSCRASCQAWFYLGLPGPSFYSQLARRDHFQLHFLFVLNEQLLFFLPYSGNHRIPYPEAEWQDDGD